MVLVIPCYILQNWELIVLCVGIKNLKVIKKPDLKKSGGVIFLHGGGFLLSRV
jgi:hypothetical protein